MGIYPVSRGTYSVTAMKNITVKQTKELYSVGDLCLLAGITRKTLFYYDRIDLLKPTCVRGTQNHKMYDRAKLEQLDQILQYRKAGLRISEMKQLLNDTKDPEAVLKTALKRLTEEKRKKEEEIQVLTELIMNAG